MNTEQCVPAQYFHIPVVDVEGVMRDRGCGVDWRFVIRGVCDGEVGETGDAYGRRSGNRSYRDYIYFWGSDRIGWRGLGLGNLRFGVSTRESQGCDDRGCSGVSLAFSFLFPGREYRWRREAFPATIP